MLFLKNCAVGHVPKCAGRFVRKCLVSSDTTFSRELPDKHGAHLTPDVDDNMGVIFFVRHPYTWLRSLHAHRNKKGWNWDNRYELESKCQHPDFSQFITNICQHKNIVFEYFETYFAKYRNHDLKIGKVENITEDLVGFLNYFNEDFNVETIGGVDVHMANPAAKSLSVDDTLITQLLETQSRFYNEYGYNL
jgi:hypothetical protein